MSIGQKFFKKISSDRIHALQAHTGVIFIFRYNHKGKNKKRRYGLARHVKIDFYIFGYKKTDTEKNFTGKTEKIYRKFSIKICEGKNKKD